MASRNSIMDEPKILKRGEAYLTPMQPYHIDEFVKVISKESVRELALLGYDNIRDAISEAYSSSGSYIVRGADSKILCVGGLWHEGDQEFPQMFAMFSKDVGKNFQMLARGSRMLVQFLGQAHPHMTMTILSEHESMLSWATWLGFEPIGFIKSGGHGYVEFVRCNLEESNVYNRPSRPAKH